MALHKELTALFRHAEPPAADYQRQADRPEDGYVWKQIDFALVLSASGALVGVEGPPWRMGRRRRGDMLVPSKPFLCPRDLSGFLWGQSTQALGLSRSRRDGALSVDETAFNHFRIFHRAILSEVNDPSIRAFMLFLKRWDPASLETFNPAHEAAGGAVAFRFQYENEFLHERDAARRIWARRLNPQGAAVGPQSGPDSGHPDHQTRAGRLPSTALSREEQR